MPNVELRLQVGRAFHHATERASRRGNVTSPSPVILKKWLAEQMVAGAQLVYFDLARAPHAGAVAVQFDQAVDQRVFRMRLVARKRREDQRRAARGRDERAEFMDELRQFQLGRAEFAGAAKAVDDHEARAVRLDRRRDQREEARQAVAHQLVIAGDEEHAVGDRVGVVEREALQVREQLRVRFGDQRDVQHHVAFGHTVKADLRGQDRLARARHAFDQVQAAFDQSAAEDVVETGRRRS